MNVQQLIATHWPKAAELDLLCFIEVGNRQGQFPLLNYGCHQALTPTSGTKNAKEPEVITVTEDFHIVSLIMLAADTTFYGGN